MHKSDAARQARAIEQFARKQGVTVVAKESYLTSQVLAHRLVLHDASKLKKLLGLEASMALALEVDAVRIGRNKGTATCEVSLPPSEFAVLPLAHLTAGRKASVAVGLSVLQEQVNVSLASEITPHALIAGATGAGKTVLLQTILSQLVAQNSPETLDILAIDGKARGLLPFRNIAHLVHPLITNPQEAVQALTWATAEMDRRKHAPDERLRHMVVVIDEIAEIINLTGGKDGLAAQSIASIAGLGRELGIHLLLATQHPVQDVLGGSLARANLTCRFAMKVVDPPASRLATGLASLGAERLRGRGDCILVAGGSTQRFQVAMADPDTFDRLPRSNGHVRRLDLEAAGPEIVLDAVRLPTERADPLTPEQIGWVLAHVQHLDEDGRLVHKLPGIGTIAKHLEIGKLKAGRLQAHCQEITDALAAHGCAVYSEDEDEESEDTDDE